MTLAEDRKASLLLRIVSNALRTVVPRKAANYDMHSHPGRQAWLTLKVVSATAQDKKTQLAQLLERKGHVLGLKLPPSLDHGQPSSVRRLKASPNSLLSSSWLSAYS